MRGHLDEPASDRRGVVAFVTITTVGYGDRFSMSTEGRLVSSALMTAGVGLLGTFTGFVASWFMVSTEQETESELAAILAETAQIKAAVTARPKASP